MRPAACAVQAPWRPPRCGQSGNTSIANMPGLFFWPIWPAHFSAEFRRHFGVPPVGYLIRRRLHHAAYLLQDVNLSVAEAGQRVGYDDLFYFSKLFKRFHGASPRAWRERSRL